jgi:hypothetical protein
MIQDAKSTPRASFFNSSIVDKIAKADMKYAADGITTTSGNLGVSGLHFMPRIPSPKYHFPFLPSHLNVFTNYFLLHCFCSFVTKLEVAMKTCGLMIGLYHLIPPSTCYTQASLIRCH